MRWAVPLVVCALALAWWTVPRDAERTSVRGEIQTELLDPYGAALAREDWQAALAWMTSDYRQHTSDVVFMTGQARNQDEWGPLDAFLTRVEPEEHRDEGARFYRVDVERVGALSNANAAFDVVLEDGGWRIQQTWWVHPPSPATPRVF